jgi:spermidine synthase
MGKELYRMEDDDGAIVVTQRGNRRLLSFGSRLEQSSVLMMRPHYLIHQYTQIMLLGLLFIESGVVDDRNVNSVRMTILGLGGGALAHCLSHFYPRSYIEVVEIRQAVIDIAYNWFDLPRHDNLHVVNADAFTYLRDREPNSADIIFSDLYQAEGMSTCQAKMEFIDASYAALSEQGCLVLNFHQKPDGNSELMTTIENLFVEIVVHDSDELPGEHPNTIMFCCKGAVALHQAEINRRAELLTKKVKMPLMQYYRQLLSKAGR